jgi:hypothetical protein
LMGFLHCAARNRTFAEMRVGSEHIRRNLIASNRTAAEGFQECIPRTRLAQ